MAGYRTVAGTAFFTFEEKRSRFIAAAAHAETEAEALAVLERVRAANRTARHNVYAYVLNDGNRTRYSDDGEPAKTAGAPVLECIRHAALRDVIVVVTRYFGGVLLGTGGLVRAYTAAASGALQQAHTVTMRAVVRCRLSVPYAQYEAARRLIADSGAQIESEDFTAAVHLSWLIPVDRHKALCESLAALLRGGAPPEVSAPFFAPL